MPKLLLLQSWSFCTLSRIKSPSTQKCVVTSVGYSLCATYVQSLTLGRRLFFKLICFSVLALNLSLTRVWVQYAIYGLFSVVWVLCPAVTFYINNICIFIDSGFINEGQQVDAILRISFLEKHKLFLCTMNMSLKHVWKETLTSSLYFQNTVLFLFFFSVFVWSIK